MANDCIPYKEDGDEVTGQATAAITGKKLVQISGARTSGPLLSGTSEGGNYRVAHPSAAGANGGAGKRVLGVASWDTAVGGKLLVRREGILPVTTGAPVTAGQSLEVAADGSVIPLAAGVAVGMALNDAGNGADCEVCFYDT